MSQRRRKKRLRKNSRPYVSNTPSLLLTFPLPALCWGMAEPLSISISGTKFTP